MKNKGLVSIAGVVVRTHQTIYIFHRKINRKITQLRDMKIHNKNTSSYNSVVVVLLMTSVAFCSPATRPTMIRNTTPRVKSPAQHSIQLKNYVLQH